MNYEERMKYICSKCPLNKRFEACGYLMRNMMEDCASLQNIMYGWELGQHDTLEEIEAVLNKGNESRCDDFFTIAEIKRKFEQLKK